MGIRILIVDDSPSDRELARYMLRDLASPPGPAECVTVADWSEAAAPLEAGGVDLLLLDYNMPGLTGLDILREVERRALGLPVIMLTGQGEIGTAVQTLREGARDYVPKAADASPLLCRAVERVLAEVAMERELAEARARLAAYAAELEHKVEVRTAVVRAQAAEIEQLYLRSEEAARLKSEILSNVSHELRTPLNVVLGYGDLLQQELEGLGVPSEAQDMLRTIRSQGDRLRNLVEALLNLRTSQGGADGIVVSSFSLAGLREELRGDALVLNADKGLALEWSAEPADCQIVGDREKVRTIAYHLLSNAIKFTPAGRVDVTLAATASGGVRLSVRDTGIGLPPEARDRIFEDFRQLDGSSTRLFEGLGLGLGIIKRYTALLGGTLKVESVPGEGTSVTVDVPGASQSASPHGTASATA